MTGGVGRVPPANLVHRGLGRVELFDLGERELAGLGRLLDDLAAEGRDRVSFHAPLHRPDWFPEVGVACHFLAEDPELRERSFRLLEHTLELADRWQAEYVVTHLTFGPTDTRDTARADDLAEAALQRMAEMSHDARIPIDVEFAAYSDAYHDPEAFAAALAWHPELGTCIDIGHTALGAMLHGRDLLADLHALAPGARSLHLWNTTGPEHTKAHHHTPLHPSQRPEDGWIDIAAAMADILFHAPEVNVIFEYPVDAVTDDIQAGYDWVAEMVRAVHA